MKTLDEATLIAYVDGELDRDSAAEVETRLEQDGESRAYVARLREFSALARIAFNDILHSDVPQRLVETARTPPERLPAGRADGQVVALARRPGNDWRRALPMAAALAGLVIGGSGGYGLSESQTARTLHLAALTQQLEQSEIDRTLNRALEINLSGRPLVWHNPDDTRRAEITPIQTYQDKTGRFCREYRQNTTAVGETRSTHGLACRDDGGQWKTRYLIVDEEGQSL